MFHSFFGGVSLPGRKENTQRKPLSPLEETPEEVVIPLTGWGGLVCAPLVRPGQRVSVGEPIGRPEGMGAWVHASVSGCVSAVEERPHPWGGRALSVVIRSDGEGSRFSGALEAADFCYLSGEEIIRRLARSGVTGMGGGGFPTHEKLARAAGRVDTLIINAAESEPYVTADHRLLLERGESILTGAQMLLKATGAQQGILAVEGNKLDAAEALERRLKKRRMPVRVRTLPSRYPLGSEKQVVKVLTGREVPPGGDPVDVGCLVLNAATVFAAEQALSQGRPLTHRAVAVTGGALVRPRNLWVPIGTPLRCLIQAAGGFREEPELILMGGPMMGVAQSDLDAPVLKETNALLCLSAWEREQPRQEERCIRCGRCVSVCPMRLMPLLVDKALKLGEPRNLEALHVEDCIQCGCCTYICPSGIPLLERMRQARQLTAESDPAPRKEAVQ